MNNIELKILSPIDGDMLHARDGKIVDGSLHTTIQVAAEPGSRIAVNGKLLSGSGNVYSGELILDQYRNTVTATNESSKESRTIVVYRLPEFAGYYRLSIDDNIWFLQDLTDNAGSYKSLFDNPFLGFLKELNSGFNTKVHLNLFYKVEGFDLSQMTDKFREEWKQNANWLRLSFHALQEFPNKPYQHAGYEEVSRDCQLVDNEIKRFAGKELIGPVTTIHWGEATVEGSRAMKDQGYKGQLGYFNVDDDQHPVSYYLNVDQRRHIKKRFVWKDNAEDIVFVRTSIVIDRKKKEEIVPFLDRYVDESRMPPYLDLLVHEQYFYPHYQAYQPDYREKIVMAVKWAHDNGYQPAFLSDCIFEKS